MPTYFTPKQQNSRWYANDGSEPTTALANETTDTSHIYTPTVTLRGKIRLRCTLAETGGKAGSNKAITVEYSTNDSSFTAFGAGNHWNYADGLATNGNTLAGNKLTDCGTNKFHYHEDATGQESWVASTAYEIDFCVVPTTNVSENTTYYFRFLQAGTEIPLNTSEAHPRVLTATSTNLVVSEGSHAHSSDAIILEQVHILTPADSTHAETPDAIGLTQVHILTVQDGTDAQAIDPILLTQIHKVTVNDVSHSHYIDGDIVLEVSVVTELVVQDGSHTQTTDGIGLTQLHKLSVAESSHELIGDGVVLVQIHTLGVAETNHNQNADGVVLGQLHKLASQNSNHSQSVDAIGVTQVHLLVVQDSSHNHIGENIVLEVGGVTLTIQGIKHNQSADNPNLTQIHILGVQDSVHSHLIDGDCELVPEVLSYNLFIQDSLHTQTGDSPTLGQIHNLLVQDGNHANLAAKVIFPTTGKPPVFIISSGDVFVKVTETLFLDLQGELHGTFI